MTEDVVWNIPHVESQNSVLSRWCSDPAAQNRRVSLVEPVNPVKWVKHPKSSNCLYFLPPGCLIQTKWHVMYCGIMGVEVDQRVESSQIIYCSSASLQLWPAISCNLAVCGRCWWWRSIRREVLQFSSCHVWSRSPSRTSSSLTPLKLPEYLSGLNVVGIIQEDVRSQLNTIMSVDGMMIYNMAAEWMCNVMRHVLMTSPPSEVVMKLRRLSGVARLPTSCSSAHQSQSNSSVSVWFDWTCSVWDAS